MRQQDDFAESVGAIMTEDEEGSEAGAAFYASADCACAAERRRPSASGGRTATVFLCDGRGHIQVTFKQASLLQGSPRRNQAADALHTVCDDC